MLSQAVLVSFIMALAEARFGQEQVPIPAISALSDLGAPGEAAKLAGGDVSTLLAAANPCAKLQAGDAILANLGTSDAAVAAAKGLVAAEQNFNPFVVSVPSICSDASLPTNALLRGVVPLIDPDVVGSDIQNANSKTSLTTSFPSDGLSVAQIMVNAGFSNFTTKALDGTVGTAAAGSTTPSGGPASVAISVVSSAVASVASVASSAATDEPATSAVVASTACIPTTLATVAVAATSSPAAAANTSAAKAAAVTPSTISGLDFGLCTPTMKFEAGLDGRSATEFTFQAIDPLVNKGQEEALNPNIITTRICDQLTNVCNANMAAKTACTAAKAQISALGTKDATTADAWNTALGFEGTNTNPDDAPQAGLLGHD